MLDQGLKNVVFPTNSKVLVGLTNGDDAGIYLMNENVALVHTTDFFTPVVDDPYLFGKIAASNALSDIYAMGAEPQSALNIICFPDSILDAEAFRLILQGGADKIKEAGAVILGGHSVSDKELKYGLAVTGTIEPKSIKINNNLRIGDKIILTKPLGTGILTTALKNGVVEEKDIEQVIEGMVLLNREPARLLRKYNVSACTDVTGYGLLGHLWEMMRGLDVSVIIYVDEIPYYEQALEFAQKSQYIPGGTLANIKFNQAHIETGNQPQWLQNLLFDPQTSGGLLLSIPESNLDSYLQNLKGYPFPVKVIGEVSSGENQIFLK